MEHVDAIVMEVADSYGIEVEGAMWNDWETDTFYFAMGWVTGLNQALEQPGRTARSYQVEISDLHLRVSGDVLTFWDDAGGVEQFYPTVSVSLEPFARALLKSAEQTVRLAERLRAEAVRRGYDESAWSLNALGISDWTRRAIEALRQHLVLRGLSPSP